MSLSTLSTSSLSYQLVYEDGSIQNSSRGHVSLLRAQPYGSGYKYTVEALCTVDFDGTQFAAGDIIPDVLDSFLKPFVETNVDEEEEEEECDEASIVTNDSDSEDGDASSDDDDDQDIRKRKR